MLPLSENELDELVARERERGAPPLTDWDSLADRLRAEGLIKEKRFGGFNGSFPNWRQCKHTAIRHLAVAVLSTKKLRCREAVHVSWRQF